MEQIKALLFCLILSSASADFPITIFVTGTSTCAALAKDAVNLLNSKFFEGEEVDVTIDENM